MHRTVVINVVGLTSQLLGPHTPQLSAFASEGGMRPLETITPAVTSSVQSSLLTGSLPREHGIVGNGWYFRDLSEVRLCRQSNRLVAGEKVWETAKRKDPSFTCANMFWSYNMYSSVDFSATPRPMYTADGRKLPDVYTHPPELRTDLQAAFGTFPLVHFWGPNADLSASEWIGRSARRVFEGHQPTLMLVCLPHLDHALQKYGPSDPRIAAELTAIDGVCGELIRECQQLGGRVIVHSEYGTTDVSGPVHINRALRQAGLIAYREEQGREQLDPGACEAFAVADHQVAHVYVRNPERVPEVQALLAGVDGIEAVHAADGKRALGLDHPRSGELVAVSRADRWFTYYFWLDDDRAPDYARTVDIHRKPGYDPVELFVDPSLRAPMAHVGFKLAKRKLGFRGLLDVIPLDASLVRGSHGRVTDDPEAGPLVISEAPELFRDDSVSAMDFKQLVLDHVFA